MTHFLIFPLTKGNTLLYLDPHTTQQAVNPEKLSQIPDEVRMLVFRTLVVNTVYVFLGLHEKE